MSTNKILNIPSFEPISAGEIIKEDFLKPLKITEEQLAIMIGVNPSYLREICQGTRATNKDTAFLLAEFFGTTMNFWVNIQLINDIGDKND